MRRSLLARMQDLARRRVPYAYCLVADAKGSVPGKPGFAMVVTADDAWGTIGGAGLEEKVKLMAREALRGRGSRLARFDLASWKPGGLDSVCGGTVDVAIQVVQPTPSLLLVGAGHVAKAIADAARPLEWDVTVVDDRPEWASRERYPAAEEVLVGEPAEVVRKLDLSAYTHVYVLGYDHHKDAAALAAVLNAGYRGVVGLVGSAAKRRSFEERARAAGAPEEALAAVRCPIGLDVGAETPEEIAVAVLAEVLRDAKKDRKGNP